MRPDPRFYETLGPVALGALASVAGATLRAGDDPDAAVATVAQVDAPGPGVLVYLEGTSEAQPAAGVVITTCAIAERLSEEVAVLIAASPRAAFARAAPLLVRERALDPRAPAIHPDAQIEEGVVIGHGVVIGAGAEIGAGARIGANAVIGPGVAIGRATSVEACAVVTCAFVGDRVRIGAGCVIGRGGFGVAGDGQGLVDVPQLGRVIIQDDVSLGGLCTVDRGAFADTIIGAGAKFDSHCHVAHNCRVGRNVIAAAYAGLSGSVTLGDGVMMGGRVGVADHLTIGAGARLSAGAAVMHDVPPGETWGGYPAKPSRRWMRETATLARLALSPGIPDADKGTPA